MAAAHVQIFVVIAAAYIRELHPGCRYNPGMSWRERFDLELAGAIRARGRGNEGQARVCARRAAGIAATEYYIRRGLPPRNRSAIHMLQQLRDDSATPLSARLALDNLLLQVSEDFKLPPGIDLIADARVLCDELLPDAHNPE